MSETEKKSTHKVEIVPIVLEKHPNADSLSIVRIWAYQVVVKTADWANESMGAYIVPDSMVPDTPQYAFLRTCLACKADAPIHGSVSCKTCGGSGYLPLRDTDRRIRVRKFRGQTSQGMLVKAPAGSKIGDDVSEILGVTRYEPPEPGMGHGGTRTGPVNWRKPPACHVPVYDVENWYRYGREVFKEGEFVYITEKIHGSNARFVYSSSDDDFFIGSRRHWLREFTRVKRGWFGTLLEFIGILQPIIRHHKNIWFDAAKKYPDIERWCRDNPDIVLYGEVYGKQDLKYGIPDGDIGLAMFDTYVTRDGFSLFPDQALYGLPSAPCIDYGPYSEDFVRKHIDGKTLLNDAGHIREGIVIHSLDGRKLKAVSDAYLERAK